MPPRKRQFDRQPPRHAMPRRPLGESHHAGAYPSLRQHMATRRRFLGLTGAAGATLATGSLLGACMRSLGATEGDDAGAPDARTPDARTPDGHIEMPGEMPWPDYFTLRIPATNHISAYLVDGGYCGFFVELVTYEEPTYLSLLDHMSSAETRCRNTVSELTYDTLNTAAGISSAEDDLLDALDALAGELNGHTNPTIEAVTLTLVQLEPYAPIDGGMPQPSYP
jgi:hypothetical protein